MKRTSEDQQFGEDFASKLRPLYARAIASGETEKSFAKKLGVDRGGLQRYLKKHAMPSLRTLVFAYQQFGIAVPYAGSAIDPIVSKRDKKNRRPSELQMNLPLTIEATEGEISLVIKKKSPSRYRLQLSVKKMG
jgi:transcriptional regulator with XRE-family HTH domain